MAIIPDISYFLARKYAIQQQGADAGTTSANAQAKNAATAAMTGAAAARLDNTRADILPTQARAEIGQTDANAALLGLQAQTVLPESKARIADINSGILSRDTSTAVTRREGLTTRTILPASLAAVMGGNYPGYQLGGDVATRPSVDPDEYVRRFGGVAR